MVVNNVRCSADSTILLTDAGALLGMGLNVDNKLGLNRRQSIFTHMKVSKVVFVLVVIFCRLFCYISDCLVLLSVCTYCISVRGFLHTIEYTIE